MAAKRQQPIRRPKTSAEGVTQERDTTQAGSDGKPSEPQALPAETIEEDKPSAAAAPTTVRAARFPVVGIGASAGGLEALQEFFQHLPADSGMAFVVVTHQHPGHVSLLPSLLSKATSIPVVEAHDGLRVEPNQVYVGLPGGLLGIAGGVLHRLDADSVRAPHLPIDHFLRSLAVDQREHAICVVLSGTGSDGTLGVRAIKAESGMVMVQEPPSAKYAGMPASAAATGLADYVLPAAAMPEQLIAYTRGPYLKVRTPASDAPSFSRESLQQILALLRVRTGHDFTCYKTNTIRRRIERRMNVHQIKEPAAYVRYLRENLHELDVLFGELLISVTGFFRDPHAFEALAEKALPGLIASHTDEQPIRVWVPGCASGEEAYTVAMLLRESLENVKRTTDVQVFGTDLDAHAIDAARAGIYPAGITADVSKERLERFFTHNESIYQIRKEIREMLVFAPQNVIKDPPFTKLDLVVCRNLLIYLDAEMQRRLLPIFHYSLRPGGVLFLGPSESIGSFDNLFEPLDSKWKIFRRRETVCPVNLLMELPPEPAEKHFPEVLPRGPMAGGKRPNTTAHVERLLLSRFAPTSLIVDERGNIVYIHGRTGAYLEPTEGQPRHNVLEMARHGLARPLGAALRQAVKEKTEVVRPNVRVKTNGDYVHVTLSVTSIAEPEAIRGLLLITIQPAVPAQPPAKARRGRPETEQPAGVAELEQELQYIKESLQTTIEELETSNEELKSTNEELQSTNEELQSSNEELETSKEEMQSLNEELNTVNTELQAKVEELSHSTDDMQNLLDSTQVATIFLDIQLNVKRYTEPARQLFNLIQTDIGRPLSHLTCNIVYDHLIDDCRQVLQTLVPKEAEVCSRHGKWYLGRAMPYRTAENVIDGVVVTFVDITRLKAAEQQAADVWDCLTEIVQAACHPMVVLDAQLRVAAANRAFGEAAQASPESLLGRHLFEVGGGQWGIAPIGKVLEDLLRNDTPVEDFQVERQTPEGRRVLLLNARPLKRGREGGRMIGLSLVDQTPTDSS
jgi:two-component system, chemotaxis family, CheB/CheR fusion protein